MSGTVKCLEIVVIPKKQDISRLTHFRGPENNGFLACVASASVGFSARSKHFSLFGGSKIGASATLVKFSRVQKAKNVSNLRKAQRKRLLRPGGGYSRQFRIGVCRQGSQTLTLFKGRKSRIDTLLKAQNQEMAPYLREKDNS